MWTSRPAIEPRSRSSTGIARSARLDRRHTPLRSRRVRLERMESGRLPHESPVDIAGMRMRPPDRIFYQRLRPAAAALGLMLWLIPAAVTVGAYIVGGMTGRPWLPLPAVLL